MTTRRKTTNETDLPDEMEETAEISQTIDQEQDADDLNAILSDLGGDSSALITVSRVNRQGKREVIDRYHPADFDVFSLRDEWGGGEYILTGRRGNRIAKGFPRRVYLAEKKEPTRQPETNQDQGIAAVLREGLQQQQDQLNKLTQLIMMQQQGGQRSDPDEMRRSIINEMATMKELFGGGNQQTMGPEKILELLKTGMEIGKESSGGETSMLDVLTQTLRTFGEPLTHAMQQQQMNQQQNQGGRPGAQPVGQAQPINHQAQAGQGGQSSPGENDQMKMIKMYVGHLVNEAKQGSDPLLWADVILSKIPEEQLKAVLSEMDPVDYLGNIDNRVYTYREWFAALGDDLKKQLGIKTDHVREPDQQEPGNPPIDGSATPGAVENDGATGDHPER